jgi:hypothetical protein
MTLHQIAPATAEQEQISGEEVLLQHGFSLCCQRRLRMSVTPAANQTRVLAGIGITLSGPGSDAPRLQDHSCR